MEATLSFQSVPLHWGCLGLAALVGALPTLVQSTSCLTSVCSVPSRVSGC